MSRQPRAGWTEERGPKTNGHRPETIDQRQPPASPSEANSDGKLIYPFKVAMRFSAPPGRLSNQQPAGPVSLQLGSRQAGLFARLVIQFELSLGRWPSGWLAGRMLTRNNDMLAACKLSGGGWQAGKLAPERLYCKSAGWLACTLIGPAHSGTGTRLSWLHLHNRRCLCALGLCGHQRRSI